MTQETGLLAKKLIILLAEGKNGTGHLLSISTFPAVVWLLLSHN